MKTKKKGRHEQGKNNVYPNVIVVINTTSTKSMDN